MFFTKKSAAQSAEAVPTSIDGHTSDEASALLKMEGVLEKVATMFEDAAVGAVENYQAVTSFESESASVSEGIKKNSNDGIKYSLKGYTQKQKENWKNAKRIVLYDNDTQFADFIRQSRLNNGFNKKIYFGAVPHDLAVLIKSKTGIDVENFNCSLSAYEIRKIFKDHGDEKKEAPRGQRAITESDIVDIPKVIQSPLEIKLSPKLYEGKPVIEFTKQIDGSRFTVDAVVSDKHLDLFVQTAFVGIKKGNLAVPIGEQAPINTPKANNGTVSEDIITQPKPIVKKQIKKTSDKDYLDAINRGDMVTAQRMVDAAIDAVQNYQTVESLEADSISASEGIKKQAKHISKVTLGMTETERADVLRNEKIILKEIKVTKGVNLDWDALERNRKSAVGKHLIKKLRNLGYLTTYKTDNIDVEFEFTANGLRKSMNSQVTDYGGTLADLTKVVMNMQVLLDNSVLLEIHTDKAKRTDKENSRLQQVYVLLSAYKENGRITPVQFEVKQYIDNKNRLYLAVALTKIEASVMGDTALPKEERTRLLLTSEYSIPQLIEKINPSDENFFKYIPDEFLNDAQKNAKRAALGKEAKKYGRTIEKSDGIKKQMKKTSDADYLDAVNRGDMETAQRMVDEAARGNVQNYSDEEYSTPITMRDVETLRSIGRKSINAFTSEDIKKAQKWAYKFYKELGTKSPFFRAWFGEWRAHDRSNYVDVLKMERQEGKNPRGIYINKDTGWSINSSSVGYDETISHSGKDKKSIIAMQNIDKIIENAILIDTEVSEYGRGKKSVYTAFMHKFYAPISIDGKTYIAKMAVDESHAPGQNDTNKKFYHVRAIEIETASSVGIGKSHTPIIEDTVSAVSISELYNFVKTYDKDFSPAPEISEKVLNEDGTPKVFYHGTRKENGEFWEFDYNKAKKKGGLGFKALGQGNYFAANKLDGSELFGPRVIEAYLSIKEPLIVESGSG